jgi:hypothetical protein
MGIKEIREAFIDYQKQFYRHDEAHDLMAQSDQIVAIRDGKYDDYIGETFQIKLVKK